MEETKEQSVKINAYYNRPGSEKTEEACVKEVVINSQTKKEQRDKIITSLNIMSSIVFYLLAAATMIAYIIGESRNVGEIGSLYLLLWFVLVFPISMFAYFPTLIVAIIGIVSCIIDIKNENWVPVIRQRLFYANIVQIILHIVAIYLWKQW